MKKLINKTISALLAAALILPYLPPADVFASSQPAVTNLTISRSGAVGGTHDITLGWDPVTPTPNPYFDNRDMPADAPSDLTNQLYRQYGVQEYDVSYRDATRNNPAVIARNTPIPPATTITLNGVAPNKGSLYSFTVTPHHYHPLLTENGWSLGTRVAPAASQIREVLLMTDIEIEAAGMNDTLTITWDAPRYGNTHVFQSYRLYVARADSYLDVRSAPAITVTPADCTQIPADPLRNKGPRLSYTIKDASKVFSGFYDVAVEPCDLRGETIRDKGQNATITVNGTPTLLTYTPYMTAFQMKKAPVSLSLTIIETGKDTALLQWGDLSYLGPPSEMEIALFSHTDKTVLEDTLIRYANPNEVSKPVPMLTFTGNITNYPITLPNNTVYYGIVVTVGGATTSYIYSEIAAVVPSSIEIKPNTPDIHLPIGANADNTIITLYWDAFLREPFENDPEISTLRIGSRDFTYDNNVLYDLYVVDDLETLNYAGIRPLTLSTRDFGEAVAHMKNPGDETAVPAYTYNVVSYTDQNLSSMPLQKNKLYYVKLVAKKQITDSSGTIGYLESEPPAYTTIYIPIDGDISSPPMLRKPPLSIRKDSNGSDIITPNSVDVKWLTKWSEVYDYSRNTADGYLPDANSPEWQTKAAKDGTILYYGDDSKGRNDQLVDFCAETDLSRIRDELLGIGYEVPARTLSMNNCLYEAKAINYNGFIQDVNAAGGYENYLEGIMEQPTGTNGWSSVTPNTDENGGLYITMSGLMPETSYAILLRAYRVAPDGSNNLGYASFLPVTTIPPQGPIDITPTPPVVEAVSSTDTAVVLRWVDTSSFDYELAYSDVYYQNIESQYTQGYRMSYEEVMEKSTVTTVNGVRYRYLTVEELFPDTEYYFWVRARSQTGRESFFSNPAYLSTKDIEIPAPPRGLGLVSNTDLGLVNQLGNTNFAPRDKDYIIMEWSKNEKDLKTDGSGTSTAVADVLTHPDLTETYIAKFNGLISNKEYYFRAKTILSAVKGADNKTQMSYSYLVQICLEPDFINSAEIYVPEAPPQGPSANLRQAESEWTRTVHYATNTSGDDYDSDFDPDLVPLPEQDFEIIYDGVTGTLTYRFRTNQKDEKGNYDNRVDQRFITRLVNQQVHNYNIDVTKYEDKVILKRVIEVPYTLLKTFEERRISFGIRAADVTLVLPPGTMETALVKAVPDYGDKAKLHIIFDEDAKKRPSLSYRESYAMTPQEVSLFLWTPTQYLKMPYGGKPLGVKLKLDNRYDLLDSNVGAYVKNEQTSGWSRVLSTYEKETGHLKFDSQPGMFAAIAQSAPDTVSFDQSTTPMLNVASKLSITDMAVFNGNASANSNQVINVMDAIVSGNTSFEINRTPSAETVSKLQKAGMNISPGAATVTREQAIASMVRLYEIKTGSRIIPTYTVSNTPYSDTASVQQAYRDSMLKAAEIDMLNGKTAIRPKDALSLGDLFELADVIISDAGM